MDSVGLHAFYKTGRSLVPIESAHWSLERIVMLVTEVSAYDAQVRQQALAVSRGTSAPPPATTLSGRDVCCMWVLGLFIFH